MSKHTSPRHEQPSPAEPSAPTAPRPARRRVLTGLATAVGATAATQVTTTSPAAAATPDDRSVTPPKFAPSAIDPAAQVAGARTLGDGPQQAASGFVVSRLRARDLDPHEFGMIAADGTGAKDAIMAAMAIGNALGGGGSIHLRPNQVYDVGTGLSLAGCSSGIIGGGTGHRWGRPVGSVIVARRQTGAVIDLTGFQYPDHQLGKVPFRSFAVEGSGAPGSALVGFAVGRTGQGDDGWSCGIRIDDVVISNTGGPCLVIDRLYLSEIANVVLTEPVAVVENDVPYLISRGANNNLFSRIGIRGLRHAVNVGASGAVIITSSPRSSATALDSHSNVLDSWWYENARLPEGSTLLHLDGFGNSVRDISWADCEQDPTADDTSHIRIAVPAEPTQNPVVGGNLVTGTIPGRGTESRLIRWGVDVHTPYNRIDGLKGFKGHNVRLRPGVHSTHVDLGGSLSGCTNPGVVDESGYVSSWHPHEVPNRCSDGYDGQCGMTLAGDGPLPEAIPPLRGRLWFVQGSGAAPDELYICMRTAADTFEWRQLG